MSTDVEQPATDGPRQVDLVVSRIDPWTIMKLTFLLSVAFGVAMILAALVIWLLLNGLQVFSSVRNFVESTDSENTLGSLIEMMKLPRVLGLTTVFAVCNAVLLTALATISAFLYNIAATLVGGVKLTLMDE